MNWIGIEPKVIIVDNDSPDGSGDKIERIYVNDSFVKVIKLNKNVGFAKGNNVGINYAFQNFMAQLVAVSNSDIFIEDKNFFIELKKAYLEEHFAVCGPDIFSYSKGIHQSPLRKKPYNAVELNNLIQQYKRKLRFLKIIKYTGLYDNVWKLRHLIGLKTRVKESKNYKLKQYNVVLMGAFFVLSRLYYQAYSKGLFNKTFMYLEEDALALQCEKKNLLSLYDPKIKVFHYDGLATLKVNKNRINKYIFELKNTIASAEQIKKYIYCE